jgi:hypothetical protein
MEKLNYAQDLIKTNNRTVMAGFNMFIGGDKEPTYADGSDWYDLNQGYQFAKKMAKEDGIAFTKIFSCGQKSCHPFKYGGFFVCNSCGKNVEKDWWQIKVEKDGNAFCCHGLDFVNLQESNNYAFGNTFEEAIANYEALMLSLSV